MNLDKVKACIVYACSKAYDQLDAVKLNKVLWYSDAHSYMESGSSVTGARYIRKPMGPVCSVMSTAMRQLGMDGVIQLGRRFDPDRGTWLDDYPVSDETLADALSEAEKSRLDFAIKRVCMDHTTAQISDRTHGEIWELAQDGEEIPLFTMFAERLARINKEHIAAAFS